ncbi:MAG: hypothetical protein ACOYZ8_10915 [Chloroflexota bacterium]
MTRRDLLLLFLLGLAVPLAIAQFQSLPGYMDADYYFGGGLQLASGRGFTEPYLWNYLDDPAGLPHPSHTYWMPLASIVAALGMSVGGLTFSAARLPFLLLAACVPPLTATLAFSFSQNRALAFVSGLLACFPVYYAPFLPVTDNYAIYMLLGASFLLLLSSLTSSGRNLSLRFVVFGLLSGLMTLARSDGLLWLGITFLLALWQARQLNPPNPFHFTFYSLRLILFASLGYLLVMGFWYARNLSLFDSLMAPGTRYALWITSYNETFAYPPAQVSFENWLAAGVDSALNARLAALRLNLLNAFAAQGGIFLFPFIALGLWQFRRDLRVRIGALAWIGLLLAMTLVFPFAGPRGAFFHAGAALQPLWWSLAPLGLDAVIGSARRRGWFTAQAFVVFRGALVALAFAMTVLLVYIRVIQPGWESEDGLYVQVERRLVESGAQPGDIVIARNPPGYYVAAGRAAIALPSSGLESVLAVAARFDARYLVLEEKGVTGDLRALYDSPDANPSFEYLGDTDGTKLFEILR